ncbi:hypothetical protein EJ04DRAFT_520971 [Polyplosphaeria fusca]|uniref:Uncharacterized protein n=1 Tax=Polyplosphaeria fusca TaxID=682080 RepID=A0A9P4R621_9PLEO|nr:hypothetical protein EJ04DRAFT_520971 [Polyplosphaeria fusca]
MVDVVGFQRGGAVGQRLNADQDVVFDQRRANDAVGGWCRARKECGAASAHVVAGYGERGIEVLDMRCCCGMVFSRPSVLDGGCQRAELGSGRGRVLGAASVCRSSTSPARKGEREKRGCVWRRPPALHKASALPSTRRLIYFVDGTYRDAGRPSQRACRTNPSRPKPPARGLRTAHVCTRKRKTTTVYFVPARDETLIVLPAPRPGNADPPPSPRSNG